VGLFDSVTSFFGGVAKGVQASVQTAISLPANPSAALPTLAQNLGLSPTQTAQVVQQGAPTFKTFDTAFGVAQLAASATGIGGAAVALQGAVASQPRVEK